MAADETALVLVTPEDNIEAIVAKVRSSGATTVDLLVPEGTAALHALAGFASLRKSMERDHIGLLVISSDEKTLNAAKLNQFDTLGVQGTKVVFPPLQDKGGRAPTYKTQVLPGEERPRQQGSTISAQDASFLQALEQVPSQDRYVDLNKDDAALYESLDDLSDVISHSKPSGRVNTSADEDFAATLDEWSEIADERAAPPRRRTSRSDEDFATTLDEWSEVADEGRPTRPRVRPEDIEVSAEDMRRQRGARHSEAMRERSRSAQASASRGGHAATSRGRGRMLDMDDADDQALPDRRIPLAGIVAVIILLILGGITAFYLFNRATVTVTPPESKLTKHPYTNVVVSIIPVGNPETNPTAIQAQPVTVTTEVTVQGQVISETLSPVSKASGTLTVINTLEQPIDLPEGTEFVGTNGNGQTVGFLINTPATVPPAVTTSSLSGRSTTYGQIEIAVTARAPGAASNLGENAIKQIIIPGQTPMVSGSSNFLISHGPIGGGSDQPMRIVTKSDIQRVLGEALTSLYNIGLEQLRAQIDETKLTIDPTTISPNPDELADPNYYEPPVVSPGEGQAVDPNNPIFTMTVKTHFSALATPQGRLIGNQLEKVTQNVKLSEEPVSCEQGKLGSEVGPWRWDGQRLTIDGAITCIPGALLPRETLDQVRNAVRGQSRATAEESLEQLRQQGKIGTFVLPNKDPLPSLDLLLSINTVELPLSPTPGETTQPTTGKPREQ